MKTKTFFLALFAQLFTITASAYDALVNNIYYNLDNSNKTATVTAKSIYWNELGTSYSGSVSIPSSVTYNNLSYKVTAIDGMAFQRTTNLTSVHIPSTVTSIASSAFSRCTGLTSINIPSSVREIGSSAFSGCTGLTSINIPSSVREIGSYLCNGCTSLTSISIPASVTKIGCRAFYGCSDLSSITIPTSVTFIENEAFEGTPWFDTWLESQSNGPCYINTVLFTYKGIMPTNTSIAVNNGTTCIGGGAFAGCSNLISIQIPQSVTSICSYAFSECGLKAISFPESISYVGSMAFHKCTSLSTVEVPYFTESGGRAAYTSPISGGTWGGNVEGWLLFAGCTSLTSATLAEGTETINSGVFVDCTNLNYVSIPSTIETIKSSAFSNCNNLTTVKIEKRVPITIDSEVFTNRFVSTLYVPEGCKSAYEAAEYWQDFAEIIEGSPAPEADIQFYTAPLEAEANSQVTLSVNLSNSVAVQGFSFDLALPEGVTVALDEDDIEMVTLSTERTTPRKTNVFDFYTNADGSLHVEASSTRGYTLDGNDGEVVQVVVNVAKGMKDGDYPLTFRNITVTDEEGNDYHLETSTSTITVLPKDPFDLNDDGEVDIADVTFLVNHILSR